MTVGFRDAGPDDRVFVISSWLDSFRDCNNAGMIAVEDFYDVMWPQIEKLIDRPGCRVVVAHELGESHLYGFIAADLQSVAVSPGKEIVPAPPLVFYVFVKLAYRRWKKLRIAGRLFEAIGIDPSQPFDYAYKTPVVSRLAHKIPLAQHQPMLARFPKGKGIRR